VIPKRPKNLNLFTIHFPLPAIVSILHRISGVVLFLLIPFLLWSLGFSLTEAGYETLSGGSDHFYIKAAMWVLLLPFCFHLVAGLRHLLSDIHIGSSLKSGKKSALWVFIISIICVALLGIWLW
jgi:succinate dehydrogenase / fumarate reductase, cytochrome b subunit